MNSLKLFYDRNRKLLAEDDPFLLSTLKVALSLGADNFNQNVTESIRDWNVESLTQVELEHSRMVFLCINVLLLDRLIGFLVVAWYVLASNYEGTHCYLDEKCL